MKAGFSMNAGCGRAIFLLCAFWQLASLAASQSSEPTTRRWVVRDVLEPVPSSIGTPLSWNNSYPMGDPGCDGQWDHVFFAVDTVGQGIGELLAAFSTTHGALPEFTINRPVHIRFDWGDYVLPTMALLRAGPSEVTALIAPLGDEVYFLDNATHQIVDTLALPPPPGPGLPPMDWFRGIANVGDTDGDGFQELSLTALATTTNRFIAGLIDGATRQVRWQHYGDGLAADTAIQWVGPGELADLDGDGVGDVLTSYTGVNWSGATYENRFLALSGRDGSLIWTHPFAQSDWTREAVICPDVSGDGIPDIFSYGYEPMAMVDGLTGQSIWEQPMAVAEQFLPPGRRWARAGYTALFTASLDPHLSFEVGLPVSYTMSNGDEYKGVVLLDARDGEPLAWIPFDGDLMPWTPDPVNAPDRSQFTGLLGDLDADGFPEVGHWVLNQALSAQWSPYAVYNLAILGQQTLFGPDEIFPGQQLQLDAVIPAAPGQTLGLLASTVFAGDGGERLDGWPTNLGASLLYTTSVQKLLHLATLGPTGRGRMSLVVPPNPALSGRPLYLRGVVTDAANPGKVLTLTSLLTVTVR